MKNVFTWIGVAVLVASAAFAQFSTIPGADWISLVGFAVGLAFCIVGIVNKAEKKDWKLYAAIVGFVAGAMLLVFAGLSESTITTLVTAIIAVAAMIAGLLISRKKEAKPEA